MLLAVENLLLLSEFYVLVDWIVLVLLPKQIWPVSDETINPKNDSEINWCENNHQLQPLYDCETCIEFNSLTPAETLNEVVALQYE